jgi:hypothetical protein
MYLIEYLYSHRLTAGLPPRTGDPLGDGTGGESIWGGEFEDEIRRDLRHGESILNISLSQAQSQVDIF